MKHRLFFLCLFTCSCTWLFAQKNISQIMVDKLEDGDYWEAKKYYSYLNTWGYALEPSIESFYKYSMADFQNKPDSAAFYLEEMLSGNRPFGLMNIEFYFRLWRLYAETLQDYEKAMSTCSLIRSYIEENPDGGNDAALSEWNRCVSDWERQTLRRATEAAIKVSRDSTTNATAIINDSIINDLLFFEAGYNGDICMKTLFDTGVTEFFVMDINIAHQIGVRKYPVYDNDTILTFNGVTASGYTGILDSVRIANITLYNIPVSVMDMRSIVNVSDSVSIDPEKKAKVNHFYQSSNIVMGLKAMKLIGEIVLDWKNNELRFPAGEEQTGTEEEPNLFVFKNRLLTQFRVNHRSLTAFIDTGDNRYVTIDFWFYEKHKEDIAIDSLSEKEPLNSAMVHSIRQNIPHEIADNPSVSFNGKPICAGEDDKVYIIPLLKWNKHILNPVENIYLDSMDAVLGYRFFKNAGEKILFDFRNMRLNIIE